MDHRVLWQAALAKIEIALSRPNFLTWFQGTGIAHIGEGTATVSVPNSFVKEWLENKYHKTVLHALREITPEVRDITYVIGKTDGAGGAIRLQDRINRRRRMALPPIVVRSPAARRVLDVAATGRTTLGTV